MRPSAFTTALRTCHCVCRNALVKPASDFPFTLRPNLPKLRAAHSATCQRGCSNASSRMSICAKLAPGERSSNSTAARAIRFDDGITRSFQTAKDRTSATSGSHFRHATSISRLAWICCARTQDASQHCGAHVPLRGIANIARNAGRASMASFLRLSFEDKRRACSAAVTNDVNRLE